MYSTSASLLTLTALLTTTSALLTKLDPNHLPYQTHPSDQYGWNNCSYVDTPDSKCQTAVVNSLDDFCLFSGPKMAPVGNIEREAVAYCSKRGHGARLMPPGTITGAHFARTPHYMQITGTGNFTKINVPKGDEGGELDPWGYDKLGNPIGGVIIGINATTKKWQQYPIWSQFISANQFCLRVCYETGPNAKALCNHIYDELGCDWNFPGNYAKGSFDTCQADDTEPAGVYTLKNGTVSTWTRGAVPTPNGHPVAKSSSCVSHASLPGATYRVQSVASSSTAKPSGSSGTKKPTSTASGTKKPTSTGGTKKPSSTGSKRPTSTGGKKSSGTATKKATKTGNLHRRGH